MDFLPLPKLPQAPAVVSSINEHTRFYHSFRHPLFIRQHHPITAIHFSPTKPHRFAVTSSSRVLIYAPKTGKVVKTITRFKDTARGAEFRKDGKLVVAGGDDGLVQVFDVNSRAILRTMKEHTLPVHVTRFSPNNTEVMSCSDDTTVKVWDVPSQTAISTFTGHTDYVRSGHFVPSNPSLLISGSYDSTVRLWDARTPNSTAEMIMKHGGAPVEDVLPFFSGGLALSAGGPILRVWDLTAGGRCIRALSNHQKTVTCMAFDGERKRVLTGGLDHMVKVYDVEDWKVVHTMRYPAPILSLAVSPDDTHIAAGMTDGTLSVRRRDPKASEVSAADAKRSALSTGAFEYFADFESAFASIGQPKTRKAGRKTEVVGPVDEFRVESVKRRKLKDYDKFLKTFQYGAALDAVMMKNTRPGIAFALIQELIYRDGLRIALRGRDDVTLEPILRFLVKNVADPRFGEMAAQVGQVVIDLYTPTLGQSPMIDDLFGKLRRRIDDELKFENELLLLKGALDMVLAQSALSQSQV